MADRMEDDILSTDAPAPQSKAAQAKGPAFVTPRCLVCDTELSNIGYFDGGCANCVGGVWADALRLRDGPPEHVAVRVAALRDWGAEHIAKAIIGPLPFTPVVGE